MTLTIGLALMAFIALVFFVCLRQMEMRWTPGWLWVLLIVGATCLLFRPDEEVEAGEDAGAYFNTALSFAQHQQLRFDDPAMVEVDPSERAVFRYGHAGFLATKDACLWSEDPQMSRSRPWFFPGYSLLLSVPAALGFPYGAFWISPLLAMMIAILLAGLAYRLTGRRVAAAAAFLLYVLHPAIVWNARCARAEWPASFLILAGLVLWTKLMVSDRPVARSVGFLAGLSLTAAMLFHVTAAYVVLPTALASLWLTRREPFWIGWWSGLVAGVSLSAAQIIWVTDPYWIKVILSDSRRCLVLLSLGLLAFMAVVGFRWIWRRVVLRRVDFNPVIGVAMSLLFILLVLLSIHWRTEEGHIPGLPAWAVVYISLTDFSGVMKVCSRLWFILALAGTLVLCGRGDSPGRLGRWLFFVLAPATMTIGWVNNYMFETRRMVTFLVPLLVLSLVVLLAILGVGLGRRLGKRWPQMESSVPCVVIVLLTAGLLWTSIRSRWPLYSTWNNRGTFDFYQKVADRVREEGDFLLAEYTQTAAPIERLADRPLLPVAWGYRSDAEYRVAEQIMARLVTSHPDRRYLLITPFSGTAIPGVDMEWLFSDTLQTRRMERLKRTVPTNVTERVRTLQVYRVRGGGAVRTNLPYVRIMDGGGLGLSGSVKLVSGRTLELRGIPVAARGSQSVKFTSPRKKTDSESIAFVFAAPSGVMPRELSVRRGDGAEVPVRRSSLGPGWEVVELEEPSDGGPFEFTVSASSPVFLSDAFCIPFDGGPAVRLRADTPQESFTIEKMESQWIKATAAFALPVRAQPSRVWLLCTHGRDEDPKVECEIGLAGARKDRSRCRIEPGWTWSVFTVPGVEGASGAFRWYDLVTRPAWNPGKSGFPDDLGLRIQRVCVTE